MKITHVVFSCSEEYSGFWNWQSKVYSGFGITPVCLLYGKVKNTTMSEAYGKVIEMEYIEGLPKMLQLTWSKFHYPTTQNLTDVYMTGDIDAIPLRKDYFVENLAGIPDDAYLHMCASGIACPRVGRPDGFVVYGSERHGRMRGDNPAGTDVSACYHVARASHYEIYTQGRSFADQIRDIVDKDVYGIGANASNKEEGIRIHGFNDQKINNEYGYYWCAEENYSSEILFNNIVSGAVNFVPFYFDLDRNVNRNVENRIDRGGYANGHYAFNADRLRAGQYVDIHCHRPYLDQLPALEEVMSIAGFSL